MLLPLQLPRLFHQGLSLGEISQKGTKFKLQRGGGTKKGSQNPSRKGDSAKGTPGWDDQGIGCCKQTPFLNPNPYQQWYRVKNMATVRVNRESCMGLLDKGMQINTIMPSFIKTQSLDVGPLSDLVSRWVTCVSLGNAFTQLLWCIVIQVQVDGVQGYLILIMVWVPIILGILIISHAINVIKEEINAIVTPWENAQVAHLLSVWRAAAMVEDDQTAGNSNLGGYDKIVLTKHTKTIDAFSSHVIITKAGIAHINERINVMTQALCIPDGSLSQGLMVQNAYTELRKGNNNVAVVVKNSMAYPQTLRRKTPVVRAAVVTQVPEPPVQTGLTGVLGEDHNHQMPKLTVKQRQEKLFEELYLSGLESWPPKLVASAQSLLAKYHNVFSLEPSKLGCTHSTEHVIKVTNDTPFKEWFRQIPLPLIEEVHKNLWEMLDSDAICPS